MIYQNVGHLIFMLILLACSAFFSGTETSFFNLSKRQLHQMKKSGHKLQNIAASLLDNPEKLLSCLLLGNMTVNVLFYAVASVFIVKIQDPLTSAAIACVSFGGLVLIGEILPKSFAYLNSKTASTLSALPTYILVKTLSPMVTVLKTLIINPTLQLILGTNKKPEPISANEFGLLIHSAHENKLISTPQSKLLTEIIELGALKVKDCLQPRVDMLRCEVTAPPSKAKDLMYKNGLTKLPIYVKKIDNIVGIVSLRQILLNPDTALDKLVQKTCFLPEQKTIESLLEFFQSSQTDSAIVVDEFGGIAGMITLEDIAEEILGPIEQQANTEIIEQTGPLEYRLSGNLSIHEWKDLFGPFTNRFSATTISGLVTTLLGRIPKQGDAVHIRNLTLTVEKMNKHRIETILLKFESMKHE